MTALVYLATPFSKYPRGRHDAYAMASEVAALLSRHGLPIFCPVAHSWGLVTYGNLDPLDQDLWYRINEPFMAASRGMIVYRADGWERSAGIAREIDYFERAGKPWWTLDPPPIVDELFLARVDL